MPKESPFDPCRQWLGIDAIDLGNAPLVLGLSPREADPMAILRAAEARLTLLRAISPGPFEMARAALIKRVEEAREKMLAEISANPPRLTPDVGGTFAMPAPPSQRPANAPPVPPMRPGMPPAPPAVATAVPPVPPTVPGGAFQGDGGGVETIAIRTTVYQKKTPVAGIALTVLALSAVAGGLVYYTYYGKAKLKKSGERHTARAESTAAPVRSEAAHDRRSESLERAARKEKMPPADPTSDRAVSSSRPPSKQKERMRPARPQPEPQEEQAPEAMPPEAVPPPPPMRKPEAVAPAEDVPADDQPAKEKPSEAMTEADAKLGATLAEVLAALRRQEDDTVTRLLAAASKQASGRDADQRVASWRQLATYYQGFLEYREKAMAAVKPGDEYDVKNQKVGVVEIDDDTFVYRVAGGNKTAPRDKIPGGIVLAIVMQWFDDNPANDLYLGAYHLAKPEPDPQRAREHWEKALAAGADASGLIPLLDDPLFAASE